MAACSPAGRGEASYATGSWQYKGEQMASPLGGASRQHRRPRGTGRAKRHRLLISRSNIRTASIRSCGATTSAIHRDGGASDRLSPEHLPVRCATRWRRTPGRERTGAICYAVGWTHHAHGRADHSRCFDHPRAAREYRPARRRNHGVAGPLQHPGQHGYSDPLQHAANLPAAAERPQPHNTLKEFLKAETVPTGWWHNLPAYMISLLRRGMERRATGNGWGYDHPKLTGDHSQLPTTFAMADGVVKGQFVSGKIRWSARSIPNWCSAEWPSSIGWSCVTSR